MKYFIVFFLFILSLGYAGYYLYIFDKKGENRQQTVSIKTNVPISQENTSYNKLLTKQFWLTATVKDVMQEPLVKEKKLRTLVRTDNKRTPLHYAVRYSQEEQMMSILINSGVDPLALSHTKTTRRTALHRAVIRRTKAYEFTKELLKYYPDIEIRDLQVGATPLLWAAYNKTSPKVIKLLLDSGADANAQTSKRGYTPLIALALPDENRGNHLTVETDQLLKMIQILLDYNVDITIKSEEGLTALDYMAKNEKINKTELFKKLLSKYQSNTK